MFNFKLVLLAIFLILGCVFVHAQEGEDNAYVAELDFEPEEVVDAYGELANPVEEEQEQEEEVVRVAPRARGGDSPCRPPSSGSGSGSGSGSSSSGSSEPTQRATSRPATSAPTQRATSRPTQKATSAPTQRATSRPATAAPTQKATSRPTSAPVTTKPSTSGSSSGSSSGGYSGGLCDVVPASTQKLKLLVPLYVYPGAAWDQVVSAASKSEVIAIINPSSGPGTGADSTYTSYMNKLVAAKVDMIGYVYTSYGARSIADVKKDIDTYATKFQNVKGIFFDEASADAKDIAFYTQAYNYVLSKGWKHSILNPGTTPAQGYVAISSSIVIFEEAGSKLSGISYPSWVTCAANSADKANYKYKFAGIAHSTSSGSAAGVINTMQNKGMGLVYVTDGAAGCCTYNALTSYMSNEASSVQSLNA